jgi:hypothetical protein
MRGVNLEEELVAIKNKRIAQHPDEILEAFQNLLSNINQQDAHIEQQIRSSFGDQQSALDLSKLDAKNIYDLSDIRNLCIKYRLRFLDGGLFKGDIPYEAIAKVKSLQKAHQTEMEAFKIVAPADLFNLKEKDKDPLLFVPLANNKFFLVHKWGNDLHPLRALLVYPFRDFTTLFKTVVAFAFLIAAVIPSSVMMGPHDTTSLHIRVILFFYLFLAFCGMTALYGFSRMKNFNSALWESKYTD